MHLETVSLNCTRDECGMALPCVHEQEAQQSLIGYARSLQDEVRRLRDKADILDGYREYVGTGNITIAFDKLKDEVERVKFERDEAEAECDKVDAREKQLREALESIGSAHIPECMATQIARAVLKDPT